MHFSRFRLFKSSLSQHSSSSQSSSWRKLSFKSRLGIFVGLTSLPVFAFLLHDSLAELPEEFVDLNYPFLARFYIRRALCRRNSLKDTGKYLDLAMQNVLSSGIGSSSPESTALVLFLARRYFEAENPRLADLEAAHAALIYKPHVGEATKEEKARLELSFKIAARLCAFYSESSFRNDDKVSYYAAKSLEIMDNGPSYLQSAFKNHPLRPDFIKYTECANA